MQAKERGSNAAGAAANHSGTYTSLSPKSLSKPSTDLTPPSLIVMAAAPNPRARTSFHNPPPSSSHRKSRWEPLNNASSDPKSGDSKPSMPTSNPSPKPAPSPAPAYPKQPPDQIPHSLPAKNLSPGDPFRFPDPAAIGPTPPPAYGFHMLERRTIVLADGSVRSYFALPPDYSDFAPPPRHVPLDSVGRFFPMGPGWHLADMGGLDKQFPPGGPVRPEEVWGYREEPFGRGRSQDYWNSLGLDGRRGPIEGSTTKRKFGDEDSKDTKDDKGEITRQRQHVNQHGSSNGFPMGSRMELLAGTSNPSGRRDEPRASKYMRISEDYENVGFRQGGGIGEGKPLKHLEVDQNALKKKFLHFVKEINENASKKKMYLEDGKDGRLQCAVCGRSSKDYPDMHGLIMHTYNSDIRDLQVDHLGFHKALCILRGWNYSVPPDNSKAYQFLSSIEAAANQDDLIMWPPLVIMHNTITRKGKDGRMEGLGSKAMDTKMRDLGFMGGKSKSLYGRDGHMGITLVKFPANQWGLDEATRLAEFFEKERLGRQAWSRLQMTVFGKDDEKNPNLVKVDEKTGEKRRVFYGYSGTAADLDIVDYETRSKTVIESRRDCTAAASPN